MINLDEKLLRQIFTDLLSNAIKYSPHNNLIYFYLIYQERAVGFYRKDEEIGIPLKDKKRLFELFHCAKNVGNIPENKLGLGIVKKCVDIHQGEISVQSEVGKGTTFTVKLPACQG